MTNNIELELRAEVTLDKFTKLLTDLNKKTKPLSHTKRLSAMFLGKINKSNFDIRVRINSGGRAELVIKKGDFHTHDRLEASQEITKNQFTGLVKILTLFQFQSKITERENYVFNLKDDITLVLVRTNSIAYVEIEKMSNAKNLKDNKQKLLKIISDYKLKLIKDGAEFNDLCNRLTKFSDWEFDGSKNHFKKLTFLLRSY